MSSYNCRVDGLHLVGANEMLVSFTGPVGSPFGGNDEDIFKLSNAGAAITGGGTFVDNTDLYSNNTNAITAVPEPRSLLLMMLTSLALLAPRSALAKA